MRNLVHYSSGGGADTLPTQIDILMGYLGSSFNGFQLNVCWPKPEDLWWAGAKKGFMVLQIGTRALDAIDYDPGHLVRKVAGYLRFGADEVDLIDAVLLDTSGGKGQPLNPNNMLPFVETLVQAELGIGIGVAGGLSGETVGRISSLIEVCPSLCIDAEGQLRDDNGKGGILNLDKVKSYFDAAVQLYAPYFSRSYSFTAPGYRPGRFFIFIKKRATST